LAAASGKLGAVLAQSLTGPLRGIGAVAGETDPSPWLPHVIKILGAFAFLGWLCSFLIPETMGRSLRNWQGKNLEHWKVKNLEMMENISLDPCLS